eukprot:GFUD01057758.1.p1 GENE.GFUD01057758.1~~GFUD01057758.1.p1  ORF type:complete len:470 (-),score=76.19 GFUD01057758.1:206-1615(-)
MDETDTCPEPSQFIKKWIKQISNPDKQLLKSLQSDFDNLDKNINITNKSSYGCEEEIIKITGHGKVDEEDLPDNSVSGSILFDKGAVFNGIFSEDLSYRCGKLFENFRSDKGTKGTWIHGLLDGFAKTDNEYGGCEEAFYKNGLKHGVAVEFGPIRSKNFMKCCFYQNGEPAGKCFKAMIGGGFMLGKMYDDKISDNKAVIVLPDYKDAMIGIVVEDDFVRGRETEVVGVKLKDGIPVPMLSDVKSNIVYKRDVSNQKSISKWPFLKDPWEHKRVEARISHFEGAGEGLFAKRNIDIDELVALYNGTRTAPSLEEDWSDYRVHLNSELDIDIPEGMRELDQYSATLSHKANHSFEPNCRWSRIDHPRFGLICSITASRKIEKGEEVTVNYRLPLHLAPKWYIDCYNEYQENKMKANKALNAINVIENISDEIIHDIKPEEDVQNHPKHSQYDSKENVEDRRQFQEQRMI